MDRSQAYLLGGAGVGGAQLAVVMDRLVAAHVATRNRQAGGGFEGVPGPLGLDQLCQLLQSCDHSRAEVQGAQTCCQAGVGLQCRNDPVQDSDEDNLFVLFNGRLS